VPYQGNAAGNTADVFDLSGENLSVPPLPEGFTARGIVALVFSCVAAFMGMAVLAW
jgi:iron transport multicopper oxidase